MNESSKGVCLRDGVTSSLCTWSVLFANTAFIGFWLVFPFVLRNACIQKNNIRQTSTALVARIAILCLLLFENVVQIFFVANSNATDTASTIFSTLTYGIMLLFLLCGYLPASVIVTIYATTILKVFIIVLQVVDSNLLSSSCAEVALLLLASLFFSLRFNNGEELKEQLQSPQQSASVLSSLLYSWMDKLVGLGASRALEFADLYPLGEKYRTNSLLQEWNTQWAKEVEAQRKRNEATSEHEATSIVWPFAKQQKFLIASVTMLRLGSDLLHYTSPLILKVLIDTFSTDTSLSFPIFLAFVLFSVAILRSFMQVHAQYGMFQLAIYLQAILNSSILQKILRLSATDRSDKSSGQLINLAAVDVEKMCSSIQMLQNLWSTPFEIAMAMLMLWITMGSSALAGVAVMLCFIPINYLTTRQIRSAQREYMRLKDERIKMSSEMLRAITVVKLYAWEESFEERIMRLREKEVNQLRQVVVFGRIMDAFNSAAPFLVAFASFTAFSLTSGTLTPSIAFVSLAIFNQLRLPMRMFAQVINSLVQASVSNARLKTFFDAPESCEDRVERSKDDVAVKFEAASLAWQKHLPSTLTDINLEVKKNSLIAVVGSVGAGKSSILSALIGDMIVKSGRVVVNGNIAYCAQNTWIQNKTIRENILFESTMCEKRYDQVLSACDLSTDLHIWPRGDRTNVGENGVTLSGGQRARVGLARAIYQERDIYLLDDPLSAVDVHVGARIFERVIGPNGMLSQKTRFLVTHSLKYAKEADLVVLVEDGRIADVGSHDELLIRNSSFARLAQQQHRPATPDRTPAVKRERSETVGTIPKITSKLLSEDAHKVEKAQQGRIRVGVYWLYFKSMKLCCAALFICFFGLHFVGQIFRSLWLSDWANENVEEDEETPVSTRLFVYGSLGVFELLMLFVSFGALLCGSVNSSLRLHHPMLRSLLRAPISFHNSTPIGVIMNRLSRDTDVCDALYNMLSMFVSNFFQLAVTLFFISFSTPLFLIIAVPLGALYFVILKHFIPTIRQLRRLENLRRSPMLSTFSASVHGASTIRAFDKCKSVCTRFEEYIDDLAQCRFLSVAANRWLAIRLELLGTTVVLSSAVLATVFNKYFGLSAGLAALSISFALNITEVLRRSVRLLGELETNAIAVERVKEYHFLPQEDEWTKPLDSVLDWPCECKIEFEDFSMSYYEDTAPVLKHISLTIMPGEKIALVGRTGSGKSSLALSLFRLVEASSGSIRIDQQNISEIGLHRLRRSIGIIPQDPVLFSGTIRFNLDPFEEYSDEELWKAIEMAHLAEFVRSKNGKLEELIEESGRNLSVGERQLMCLCRVLLRKVSILVLDEATASVDSATDARIHEAVAKHFAHSSTITIAHRLDTIAHSDRVLVLDKGQVVEFDTPRNLLNDKNSIYSQMIEKQM